MNAQNLPPEVRHCFVAPEGCVFVGGDFSNLEIRVLAYETNDEKLIDDLDKGKDIHDENTRILFQLNKKSPNWDIARASSKIFMFGGIQYGGSDRQIFEQVTLKAPGLGLTFASYQAAKNRWLDAHGAYREWRRDVEGSIRDTRKVTSAFGRVRVLLGDDRDIIKEGLNFLIQSPAATIKNQSLIQASNEGLKLILDIHDEIIVECKEEDVAITKSTLKNIMERSVDYRGTEVSFPADIHSGKDWGALK